MKNLKITVNGVAYDVQVEETGAAAPAAPVAVAPAAGISDRKAFDAAIAAAIATYMGNEPEGLRIHSIKRA